MGDRGMPDRGSEQQSVAEIVVILDEEGTIFIGADQCPLSDSCETCPFKEACDRGGWCG